MIPNSPAKQSSSGQRTGRKVGDNSQVLQQINLLELRNRIDVAEMENAELRAQTSRKQSLPMLDIEEISLHHSLEVERLCIEISRLNEVVEQTQRSKKVEVARLRDEFDKQHLTQIGALKVTYSQQKQTAEANLKKLKEQLHSLTERLAQTEETLKRELNQKENENQRLREELRQAIATKHFQIADLKKSAEDVKSQLLKEHEAAFELIQKQLKTQGNRIQCMIAENKASSQYYLLRNSKMQEELERASSEWLVKYELLHDEFQTRVQALKSNYDRLTGQITQTLTEKDSAANKNLEIQSNQYESCYNILVGLIELKDKASKQLVNLLECDLSQVKADSQIIYAQNVTLRQHLHGLIERYEVQTQTLKVKMGQVHSANVSSLCNFYEQRIANLSNRLEQYENDIVSLRRRLQDEIAGKLEQKKIFESESSGLHAKISKLRMMMAMSQTELKEKLEMEKSLMMITSQNMIKDSESKQANAKFLEEELRKLRQLLDLQMRQIQLSEGTVQKRIKLVEEEFSRLEAKILELQERNRIDQSHFKLELAVKDAQIQRLNEQVLNYKPATVDKTAQLQQILTLENEIALLNEQLGTAKEQTAALRQRIELWKEQVERERLEHRVHNKDAQEEFRKVNEVNMASLRHFYEERISQLNQDKEQLKQIESNQVDQINELVTKYRRLEESMAELVTQSNKRTKLEERVLNIGLDTNLIKNMSELFTRLH